MAKTRTQFVENGKTYFRTADYHHTDDWELVDSFPLGIVCGKSEWKIVLHLVIYRLQD